MNSRSIVFYLAVSLVFAGSALFVLSLRLTPYKDEKAFSDHYARIGDGQSREYNQLRDAMLTPKASRDNNLTNI